MSYFLEYELEMPMRGCQDQPVLDGGLAPPKRGRARRGARSGHQHPAIG